jgi:hypothetical protein
MTKCPYLDHGASVDEENVQHLGAGAVVDFSLLLNWNVRVSW